MMNGAVSFQPPATSETAQDDAFLHAILSRFAIAGDPVGIAPLGRGLINETYALTAGGRRYVLQRINGKVFPRPEQIMTNLHVLSDFLQKQGASGLRLPEFIKTRQGHPGVEDAEGALWRLMEFIPDTRTLDQIETPNQAHEVGRILGRFHRIASELPPGRLGISLPGFHDTTAYLGRFLDVAEALAPLDTELAETCAFVDARRNLACVLEKARLGGRLPTRITHGDPKLDNILFSADGCSAIALIDLDTVQPGLIHHDLADSLRSCCNRRGEGVRSNAGVEFDLGICSGVLAGYAEGSGGLLSPDEIDLLHAAIRLLPFELGLRFLTDHLQGDRYFRVTERGQNLRKAQVQFELVLSIERQEPEIRAAIAVAFG